MKPKNIANLLQKCLDNSLSSEWFNDDIQPSIRRKYDETLLAAQIETLIDILKDMEDE